MGTRVLEVMGGTIGTPGARRGQRTLPAGTLLEQRYEIRRVAGRGGMSTVYAARDLRFGQVERICAIKEMFDIDPDAQVRALRLVNFEREAALLATLSHPAIPRIYDYFSHNGLVYLVLEFIDGLDLERRLADLRGPFDESQIIKWALEITDVLEVLHDQKPDPIIFRDLKPSNIMLRPSGQIVLIDFGIARTIQGRQRGTMIGTEGYAPPEQYRGIADARGDIYALGATLHHLATNSDPRLETPFTFQERPIRALNPAISEMLSAVIMKMLAYNPADRYQTVRDLRADLEDVQRRNTISSYVAPPDSAVSEPIAAPPRRSGTTVLSLPPTAVPQAPDAPVERKVVKKRAARRRRDDVGALSERLVWAAQTGDEVRGSAAFDGTSFLIGSYDHCLYAVSPADGSIRWKFRANRGVVTRPTISGDHLIFGSEDYYIYAVNRTTGALAWSHRTGMPVRSSPMVSGDQVIVGSDDSWVYALDVESGAIKWRQRAWGPIRSSPAVTNGMAIVGCDDGYAYALAERDGRVAWRAACGAPIQSSPWADADRAIVSSRSGKVLAFRCNTGERLWEFDANAPILASPRVVNSLVIVGSADGALHALTIHDGETRWKSQLANQITASALLAERYGYVGSVDGDCVCFSTETGEARWRYHLGAGIVSTPAYGEGVLVVGAMDGRICGMALTEPEIRSLEKG